MKNTLLALIITAIAFATVGCRKNDNGPMPAPIGTFKGQFTLWKLKTNGDIDSTGVNITLTSTADGSFKITGDTTTLHAGSRGTFDSNFGSLQFNDATSAPYVVPGAAPVKKVHLNGTYEYNYDGTKLQIMGLDDAARYIYTLTRY